MRPVLRIAKVIPFPRALLISRLNSLSLPSCIACSSPKLKSNLLIFHSQFSTASNSSHQPHPSIHTASVHVGDPLFCWKCSKKVLHSGFFCPSCEVVQPVHEPTTTPHDHSHHKHTSTTSTSDTSNSSSPSTTIPYYFSIFGLPFKFDIDPNVLSSTFKKLQRKLHPDLYMLKSPNEQKFSEQQSIAINNAYKVLKDPYTRAQYMLQQLGVPLNEGTVVFQNENENGVQDGGVVDHGLLMEIMELREAVEESPPEDLERIAEENKVKINNLVIEISGLFEAKNFQKALSKTIRLRYFGRLQEELVEKLGKHI